MSGPVIKQELQTDQSGVPMEGVQSQEAIPTPTPIPSEVTRKTVTCLEELKRCLEQAPWSIVSPYTQLRSLETVHNHTQPNGLRTV